MTEKPKANSSPKANNESATDELGGDDLEQVSGGIGLLLPAVQRAREEGRDVPPTEHIALGYVKVGH